MDGLLRKTIGLLLLVLGLPLSAGETAGHWNASGQWVLGNADRQICTLKVYCVPGQNDKGSECYQVARLTGGDDQGVLFGHVDTPSFPKIDFGQGYCLTHLRSGLQKRVREKEIIHATSQGTATALNYLAEDKAGRIKGAVLEAVLASGNSAILHTVGGPLMPPLNRFARWPLAYYWMPYIAKALYPFYSPTGMQPIKSIQQISRDIPIVLAHSKGDPQLPFSGACAVYYALRNRGFKNTYFVQKKGFKHLQILENSVHGSSIIKAIFQRHGLQENPAGAVAAAAPAIDLSKYQPDPAQFKADYDELMRKERNHTYIKWGTLTSVAAGAFYLLRNNIAPVVHKVAPLASSLFNSFARVVRAVSSSNNKG